ncbi:putative Protein crooked neck [Paratrimastix pyriformis]|uniref:Uncharacterized protein n=1 Tax=Paratrimastix pyriformis TaxID=342808 RepID=A0ABQ8U3X3_9EUKA|nr:putative Protein crooked neck [Paratrimastix pyriformis]
MVIGPPSGRHRLQAQVPVRAELKADKCNYDVWFDYARLEESQGNQSTSAFLLAPVDHRPHRPTADRRSIPNLHLCFIARTHAYPSPHADPGGLPAGHLVRAPEEDKRLWRRYIYLWINFAMYEELEAKLCIDNVIPTKFTFAKMWVLYSQFLVRQKKLRGAGLLGRAIRTCPKHRIFRHAIELETQLGAVSCRQLHQRYIMGPTASAAWVRFAEFETDLGEAAMDVPEAIWKAYIDMEIAQANPEGVRAIYERLLGRAGTVKVWVSYALFETDNDPALARSKLPTRQKKQRPIVGPDGQVQGWEEYIAYTFPEDAAQARSKMLAKAKAWKLKQQQQQRRLTEGGSGEEPQEEIDTETGAASTEGATAAAAGAGDEPDLLTDADLAALAEVGGPKPEKMDEEDEGEEKGPSAAAPAQPETEKAGGAEGQGEGKNSATILPQLNTYQNRPGDRLIEHTSHPSFHLGMILRTPNFKDPFAISHFTAVVHPEMFASL